MKPQKSQEYFPQFKNKKVLIMGLGLHGGGAGAAEFFAKTGAKVFVTDLRNKQQLKESIQKLKKFKIKYILGKHREDDFKNVDLIIRNPAVPDNSPYLKIAEKHNIPIDTDIGIFFESLTSNCARTVPAQPIIIGITGTRGKSTTATLLYEFLKTKYPNTILAGNIRKSVLLELSKIFRSSPPHLRRGLRGGAEKQQLIVLELSSWQLEGLAKHKKSPHIAGITTIQPDHLNRYKGMAEYIKSKTDIFRFQGKNDFLFLNQNDKIVREFSKIAESQVVFYNTKKTKKHKSNLLGKHNQQNIAAAVKIAKHFGVRDSAIKKVLKNFKGLEGRIQKIAEINGIKYINDTTATTPDAAIAAINAITDTHKIKTNKLILIAGGADKNLDFGQLAKIIAKKVSFVILLKGSATEKLKASLIANRLSPAFFKEANSMLEAVKIARGIAKKGDTILLSPACASFGMFRHEFERGKEFEKAVKSIK